jgi:CRP/FNR family cyclic AMP-dependent transcriptional regulator
MARSKTAQLLASIPLFERCSDKELSHLAGLCTQVDIPVGGTLTRQGEVGQEFFVLVSGTAEVARDGHVRDTIGAGDHVGELALLDHAPRSATVTATSPISAVVLGIQEFWEAISTSPGMDRALLASMAHRLRVAIGALEGFQPV